MGVVVAKKMLQRAVDRNRFKRVIRERFRCLRDRLPAVDLVVRLAVKPVRFDRKLLADEFVALLERLPRHQPKADES